jgi:hypothetical protein
MKELNARTIILRASSDGSRFNDGRGVDAGGGWRVKGGEETRTCLANSLSCESVPATARIAWMALVEMEERLADGVEGSCATLALRVDGRADCGGSPAFDSSSSCCFLSASMALDPCGAEGGTATEFERDRRMMDPFMASGQNQSRSSFDLGNEQSKMTTPERPHARPSSAQASSCRRGEHGRSLPAAADLAVPRFTAHHHAFQASNQSPTCTSGPTLHWRVPRPTHWRTIRGASGLFKPFEMNFFDFRGGG